MILLHPSHLVPLLPLLCQSLLPTKVLAPAPNTYKEVALSKQLQQQRHQQLKLMDTLFGSLDDYTTYAFMEAVDWVEPHHDFVHAIIQQLRVPVGKRTVAWLARAVSVKSSKGPLYCSRDS